MPVPVLYPKVSLEEATGRISRWLVAEGDTVSAGQVIFEIENDKAAVEVEAPAAGVIHGLAAEGATVDVGAEVAQVLVADDVPRASFAVPFSTTAAPTAAFPAAAPVAGSRPPNPTPLARRIARDHALALQGLAGTGPRGRVQGKDVRAHLAALAADGRTADMAGLHAVWLRRGSGRPVVLLHGYSSDLNTWRGMLAGVRTDWPVLALDLPAHGASPRDIPADLDTLAAMVEATLAPLGVTDCVLAGHSFGAAAATRIAARGRIKVGALCLIAPAGLGPQINQPFTDGILRARQPASLRPWLDLLVHDPRAISDAFVRIVAETRADTGLTEAMARFADRFFADGTQNFSIRGDLSACDMPVRVIFGRQDRILPVGDVQGLPGHVALHLLEGCGHLPHLEHPALTLRLLSDTVRGAL